MKKSLIIILTIVLMFCLCSCGGTTAATPEKPSGSVSEQSPAQEQSVEVDEGLFEVSVTVPAEFLDANKTQADYDAAAAEAGYKSATLNEDGSVTYVMTKKQHRELLVQMAETIDSALTEMVGSNDYPNFVSISHNDNFTEFTVVSKSTSLDFNESFSVLAFYMYSGMYNAFAGEEIENCHIDFVNEASGQVFDSADSSEMQSAMADFGAPEATTVERDLPEGNYEEKGPGTVYVSTPGGTSENGNIPVLYADANSWLIQIGLNAWDFNGGALSFVYVDGILNTKEQLANTQTSLSLSGDALSVGIHTVEVVQYENDDPSAAMTVYKSMQYEIKAK